MGLLNHLLDYLSRGKPKAEPAQPGLSSMSPAEYFAGDEAWVPVSSSNLVSVAYYGQGQTGILGIRFGKEGVPESEYWYDNVPVEVHQGLLAASSKGKYHHAYIKWSYPFTRKA